MGRNSKPLVMMCHDDDLFNSIPVQELIQKGHTVVQEGFSDEVDVEFGRKCHRIDPQLRLGDDISDEESLRRQLEMMIMGRRAIKYPKEKSDAKTTKNSTN